MLKKFKIQSAAARVAILIVGLFFSGNKVHGQLTKQPINYDVVVYGGTAAGVMAAVEVAKLGHSVILIEPGKRLGGLTTGGLSITDVGNKKAVGGLAREFYKLVGEQYAEPAERWNFEPSVALKVMNSFITKYKIPVVYSERLNLKNGVIKKNAVITSIKMESGKTYNGKMFIDATYEGDLMAKSGVSYFVGREANALYHETGNGKRVDVKENELPPGVDPYRIKGDPKSGLVSRVNANAGGAKGDGDKNIQAYNFRMCLTNDSTNRVPIAKPEGYNEADYEVLFRAIERGQKRRFFKLDMISPTKTDSNNDSGASTDFIGESNNYPEATYKEREQIRKAHEIYQRGFVWTIQNHPRVPAEIRNFYAKWGLPKDEFTDNNNWPSQLYIRESRRMRSDYIITEHVVLREDSVTDAIGLGSYAMDSHHIQYYVNDAGYVSTEGGFFRPLKSPYPISYRAIIPKRIECSNLLVPICLSATHAANGSIRMEPVFMILGQSAAAAAVLGVENHCSVQDIPYQNLLKILKQDKQELSQ